MMNLTYNELLQELKEMDEISLLELLDVNSNDIVDAFDDHIMEMQDELRRKFSDEEEND